MSVQLPCETLISKIVDTGLCTRCGTCVGVCHLDNISIPDYMGDCLPSAGNRCDSCGLCLSSCPGGEVDFSRLEKRFICDSKTDPFTGIVKSAWVARAVDEKVRASGASGGIVTALLNFLIETDNADGALVYSMDRDKPFVGRGVIARSKAEVAEASQSKYHLSPMNEALADLRDAERIAVSGLPCQIHGIRKLQDSGWEKASSIGPCVGIYCGNNLYYEATRVMMKKMGVKSLEDVKRLSYREGDWPGYFSVVNKNDESLRVSKLDFNQAIPFYINHRCLFCTDLTNELSDISVGDAWSKEGLEEGGWSIVLARTGEGEKLVRSAIETGIIIAEDISHQEVLSMHAHAFDLKKYGSWLRVSAWKYLGYKVPSFNQARPDIKTGRKIAEILFSMQFMLCSSKVGRKMFSLLPVGALGPIFRWLRRTWINISRRN
ncbi:MAG: Coenzyme F420 hydrogenase/dehydrogenase, beta subunit C-terminal domain [Bacteroidales bacterium]|nr:Coenzyme F420 hydrogenase/dehydrogenase, beta subunit C-terminal domain [Candidatus Latescibacterota bacterium]